MTFGSVCSGIEAASEAWIPLGWTPQFVSEVEAFCCSLLKQKHPKVKNYGDFTTIGPDAGPIDVLVGGTPCQDFSVAGLRAGLAGERGNLTLEFVKLAGRLRPQWVVWENVPGVLSIDGGRAFGAFLGGLGQLGYGFAYRVLDAQHFGVPQRRRRVFVVGYFGDWRPAAAVLFERYSLSGDSAPRRESGTRSTAGAPCSLGDGGETARALTACKTATGRLDPNEQNFVTHSLRADGFDASEDGTGRGTPLVPIAFRASGQDGFIPSEIAPPVTSTDGGGAGVPTIAFSCKDHGADAGEISPTLRAMEFDGSHANGGGQVASALQSCQTPAVAFNLRGREGGAMPESADLASLRSASGGSSRTYVGTMAVRRLTPRECERLQGFPDDYTLITHRGKLAADGPRYKALGNSMAVPVMRWIGERIQMVSATL